MLQKKLVKTLQDKSKDDSDKDNKKETNVLEVLLEIMTASNASAMKKLTKTVKENPEIGENLPRDILDKSTNMINTVDKLCKADTEEDTTKRTIDKYIDHLEDSYGPLTDRVLEVDQSTERLKNWP